MLLVDILVLSYLKISHSGFSKCCTPFSNGTQGKVPDIIYANIEEFCWKEIKEVTLSIYLYYHLHPLVIIPSPPCESLWLMWSLFGSFPSPSGIPTATPTEAFSLVLLSKLYLLWNIIRKGELVQKPPIPKSRDIIKM